MLKLEVIVNNRFYICISVIYKFYLFLIIQPMKYLLNKLGN